MSPGDDVIPYRLTDDTRPVDYQDITPSHVSTCTYQANQNSGQQTKMSTILVCLYKCVE